MKYIEIDDGVTVRTDAIEGLRRISDMTTEVFFHHRKYLANYPYETILALLKEEEVVTSNIARDEQTKKILEKLEAVLNKSQHYAG